MKHIALLPCLAFAFFLPVIAATPEAMTSLTTLKSAAQGMFNIGVAINEKQIRGQDREGDALIVSQFNSITPENCLKWESVHPKENRYEFTVPDKYVEFGLKHGMFIIGHTLMWHEQTPDWLFKTKSGQRVSKEELLERLRQHIKTVVGRYRGRVNGWDVVNEAIDDSGKLRTDKPWYAILGEEGIYAAFAAAHEADPAAELYYNEYGLTNPNKRAGVLRLVQAIRDHGLKIDAVGLQEHYTIVQPTSSEIDLELNAVRQAGFKAMITELDVSLLPRPQQYLGADVKKHFDKSAELDPYSKGLPNDREEELAQRYSDIFSVYCRHKDMIKRVTFWGVSDKSSWLNSWPIKNRTDYPLLFDRSYQPKPAFASVIKVLSSESRN